MPLAPRDLDYFLEIARLGQLSQAAAQLDVTPAALSKAIRRLEDELGLPLFDRSGQGMRLTPFGESFQERAQRLKGEHDDALRHAGDVRAGRAGLLRIGATIAVLDTVVSPGLARLQPRRPGMQAALTVAFSDELLERTRRGQLDVCIVPTYDGAPAGFDTTELGADELVAVAREGHPALKGRRLGLARAAACAWILPRAPSAARRQLNTLFRAAGLEPPRGAVEVDFNSSWSLPLVRATDLLSLVPISVLGTPAASGIRRVELSALRLERGIAALSRPGASRSPLMEEFVQALRECGRSSRSRTSA